MNQFMHAFSLFSSSKLYNKAYLENWMVKLRVRGKHQYKIMFLKTYTGQTSFPSDKQQTTMCCLESKKKKKHSLNTSLAKSSVCARLW